MLGVRLSSEYAGPAELGGELPVVNEELVRDFAADLKALCGYVGGGRLGSRGRNQVAIWRPRPGSNIVAEFPRAGLPAVVQSK